MPAALAAEPGADADSPWRFEGYGSLGAYRGDDPVAGFRTDPRSARMSRNGRWLSDGDSMLALQASYDASDRLRAVWQLVSKDDVERRYSPTTEWLYVHWDAGPELGLKLGRMVLPLFLYSDTRNLGYAQAAARSINTVYQRNAATTLDGLGLQWSRAIGPGRLDLDVDLGRADLNQSTNRVRFDSIAVLALAWTQGDWSLRASSSDYRLDLSYPLVDAALGRARSGATGCTNCAAVLDAQARSKDLHARLHALAASLQRGPLGLQAEIVWRQSDSVLISDQIGWYALGSWRVHPQWMPYAVIGQLKVREKPLGLQTRDGASAGARAFNEALDLYLQVPADRDIWQIGLRYDWAPKRAFKVQLEELHNTRNTSAGQVSGTVITPLPVALGGAPGPAWDGRLRVLTLRLDFTF